MPHTDFVHLFSSMVTAGRGLLEFFSNFGETFTLPFFHTFVRENVPGLYDLMQPLMAFWEDFLRPFLPDWVNYLVNFSLFDLIGFGVSVLLIIKVWKAIWDALPLA